MTEAVLFLHGLAHALAAMVLYQARHPARERAVEAAYQALLDLQARSPAVTFTFLGDEIVCGKQPLRELREWDWGPRFANAGIQRLELEPGIEAEDFHAFLEDLLARLFQIGPSSAEARPERPTRIRYGAVGLRDEEEVELPTATVNYSLGAEAEAIRWLHREVQDRSLLHLNEAEAVVRSLSVAMHGERHMMIPLLRIHAYDQYTTSHSLNVAVLSMALAEFLGLGPRDARAFGVAGLLHDIGKTRVPHEILVKPGALDEHERRIINLHPSDGARIIAESEEHLDLAAVVAYEHHIMIDGGGYPTLRFRRDCHYASRVVHVCDVYDALRTNRPYRDAWSAPVAIDYIKTRAGREFDPEIAPVFVTMMQQLERRVAELQDETQPLALGSAVAAASAEGQIR
jgi:putative nucleotidyltransferase with HDIG domain